MNAKWLRHLTSIPQLCFLNQQDHLSQPALPTLCGLTSICCWSVWLCWSSIQTSI